MAAVERQLQPALLLFLVLLLLAQAAEGQLSELQWASCERVTLQGNDSFARAFKELGEGLRQKAAERHLYYTMPWSEASVTVRGMYECRGDLSGSQCSACVAAATEHYCADGSDNGIRVQLLGCYFDIKKEKKRKNNTRMFPFTCTVVSVISNKIYDARCSTHQNTDPQYQSDLSSALTQSATQAPKFSNRGFSFATVGSAHALSQCFSYLLPSDCAYCLSQIPHPSSICGNSSSGSFYYDTCYFLFSDNVLYFSNTSVDPSESLEFVSSAANSYSDTEPP